MAPLFEPIGERARWRIVYDLLKNLEVGDTLKYATIGDALGLDADEDRHTIQMAVRRAAREHEEQDGRALDSVPNVGYRIVEVPEHLMLARRHQQKSTKSLVRAKSKVVHVDLTGLDPEVRKAFEVTAVALSSMLDIQRRLDTRQRNLEQAVAATQERQSRSDEEIAELRERLDRIERSRETA